MNTLAIIGGTGLTDLADFDIIKAHRINTPFGEPSADLLAGNLYGQPIIFLARHGNPHRYPPHKINYRANIWALKQLGVNDIIAVVAVGGITSQMPPAHIAIPDQIIDYSFSREQTFFDGIHLPLQHIDFTYPYHQGLRSQLIAASTNAAIPVSTTATYGCLQGPRLETSAEIIRLQQDGCHLVGMTAMPEASLARELELAYASIAVVANWAAGKTEGEITLTDIEQNLHTGMIKATLLLKTFLQTYRS